METIGALNERQPTWVPTASANEVTGKIRGLSKRSQMAQGQDRSLQELLEDFKKNADHNDPEQLKLLEVIQKETNRLNQIRGVWNAPSTHRDWNDLKAVGKEQAPLAIEAYREYKQNLQGKAGKKLLPSPASNTESTSR
ncbi:hypothetical protein WJX75_003164 [Coccomyxa subellipsoidea]|uniref:Uncharacterized protein n=1 Tax=Coccomyxa subellipsoidea TaxID=248742 RepID=A0ABR2YSC7_9CHLO